MRIDSHQHFWKYDPARHSWITGEMAKIRRDFLPEDLEPLLQLNDLGGCVCVQVDQTESENDFLLALGERHAFIKGVVGWVDLRAGNLDERLQAFKRSPLVKGFRHVVQSEPPGFLADPGFIKGVNKLAGYGFSYDLLIYHHQLPQVLAFLHKIRDVRIVVDHLAKPGIANGEMENWAKGIAALARFENVHCKLSGMVTEARWDQWTYEDLEPYIEKVFAFFGTDRVMYGSDWPVCLLAASYQQQYAAVNRYAEKLSAGERQRVFGENAKTFYNL